MTKLSKWLDLEQVETRLCAVAAEQLGLALNKVRPDSRLIEDLHCDSLDLVELIMETEDAFGITIPENPGTAVGKQIFTRKPFRLRDLAEYAFLNQGTGSPVRGSWRRNRVELPAPSESGFTQLGGRLASTESERTELHEHLVADGEFPMYRRRTDGMVCVRIPEGEAEIGSNHAAAHEDEKPAHRVTLSSFYIDIEPVSVTAFCRFLNSIDITSDELRCLIALAADDDRQADMQFAFYEGRWQPSSGKAMQPVVLVSWHAADAYSRWANGLDWRSQGTTLLPTEAQWEYAARGSFDNQESVFAGVHHRGQAYASTGLPIPDVQQVFGQSRFGLRHMSGTIWHWCRDCYSPEFYKSVGYNEVDPCCTIETGLRSERGGSWVGPLDLCRPSYRRGRTPNARGRCLGFRCVGIVQ